MLRSGDVLDDPVARLLLGSTGIRGKKRVKLGDRGIAEALDPQVISPEDDKVIASRRQVAENPLPAALPDGSGIDAWFGDLGLGIHGESWLAILIPALYRSHHGNIHGLPEIDDEVTGPNRGPRGDGNSRRRDQEHGSEAMNFHSKVLAVDARACGHDTGPCPSGLSSRARLLPGQYRELLPGISDQRAAGIIGEQRLIRGASAVTAAAFLLALGAQENEAVGVGRVGVDRNEIPGQRDRLRPLVPRRPVARLEQREVAFDLIDGVCLLPAAELGPGPVKGFVAEELLGRPAVGAAPGVLLDGGFSRAQRGHGPGVGGPGRGPVALARIPVAPDPVEVAGEGWLRLLFSRFAA